MSSARLGFKQELKLYQAYGMKIRSELELPELLPATAESSNNNVVTVRFGNVERAPIDQESPSGSYHWLSDTDFLLEVPEVARYLVRAGREIVIDPVANIDGNSVRLYLLGSVFGALLFQRNFLVLHGNAIRIGDHCMICVGDSGVGKSTLTGAFLQQGYSILADDVVPVDENCQAVPGFPRIKLWQDAADRLGINTEGLRRIHPDMDKYNLAVMEQFVCEPIPIRWIYCLETHDKAEIVIEPIEGLERYSALLSNTYRLHYMNDDSLKKIHLQRCGQLAGKIRMARVRRPVDGCTLDAWRAAILRDAQRYS